MLTLPFATRSTTRNRIGLSFIAALLLVGHHEGTAAAEGASPSPADPCAREAARYLVAPSATVLHTLARCHARHGKTASAWAEHLEAATFAHREKRFDVERAAKQDAESLEARLSTLAVLVPPGWDVEGLVVRRDGIVLERAAWGTAAPVDPGEHRVAATAPGKAQWFRTVSVPPRAGAQTVQVGPFEEAPAPGAVGVASLTSGAVAADVPPIEPESRGGTQRAMGIALGVIGLAGIGVGTYYGIQTLEKRDEARTACPSSPCADRDAVAKNEDAKTSGTISTVSLAAGGGTLLVGAILFLTAPKSGASRALRSVDVAATPAFSGVRIGGQF
jgi:hypothetical protein